MRKNVLITGGAGYIGSVLTQKLVRLNYQVTIIDNFTFGDKSIVHLYPFGNLKVVQDDLTNLSRIQNAFENIDCVIHLAAISNDPSSDLNASLTKKVNLLIYPKLLKTCRKYGIKRFINISSIGVYGKKFDSHTTEDDPVNPLTLYAKCKVESEKIVTEFNSDRLQTINLRCGTVCGWSPRMRFDLSLNNLTSKAITENKLTVFGGEQKRPQIHIDDLTDFILHLIKLTDKKINGETYNFGGENTTVLEIANVIKEVLGKDIEIINAPPRDDERTYNINSDKVAKEFGYSMQKTIKNAIQEIHNAYQEGLWKDPETPIYHNIKVLCKLQFD